MAGPTLGINVREERAPGGGRHEHEAGGDPRNMEEGADDDRLVVAVAVALGEDLSRRPDALLVPWIPTEADPVVHFSVGADAESLRGSDPMRAASSEGSGRNLLCARRSERGHRTDRCGGIPNWQDNHTRPESTVQVLRCQPLETKCDAPFNRISTGLSTS